MELCHRIDPDCKSCGKPVYWKKRIFYLDRLWHLECFRCSRCKVRLNTDVDEHDTKYSKAFLGEDFALRCNRCDQIFEDKKLAKQSYRKNGSTNLSSNQLMNDKQQIAYDERHPIEHLSNEENLKKIIHRSDQHKCLAIDCKCLKDKRCFKSKNKICNDLTAKTTENLTEMHRSQLANRNLLLKTGQMKKCNCTGCKEYLKKFRTI